MPSDYPNNFSSLAANKQDDVDTITGADLGTTTNVGDHAKHHNDLADAVNSVEETLGLDPNGDQATVGERLDRLDAPMVRVITVSGNIDNDDQILLLDHTTPIDLYLSADHLGQRYDIKDISSDLYNNNVTIHPFGSDLIDNETSFKMDVDKMAIPLRNLGNDWYIF